MEEPKYDPRVLRTRQLLENAFNELISVKDFKDITVRDITEKATVNRATFYAHFADKYELLDATITNAFRENLKQRLNCYDVFNEESLTNIFLVMCHYHQEISSPCRKGYLSLEPLIENKMIEELQSIISSLFLKNNQDVDLEIVKTISTMLSWSIYGAAYTWIHDGRSIPAEELVAKTIPILTNGLSDFFK